MKQVDIVGGAVRLAAIGQGTDYRKTLDYSLTSVQKQLSHLIRRGIEIGLVLIDTAESYGDGMSEKIVCRAIKGCRDRVFIASKFHSGRTSRNQIFSALNQSLMRLGTDYLDLYQIHWPSPIFPIEEAVQIIETLVTQGKVRFIGVGNVTCAELQRASAAIVSHPIATVQMEYSLFDRSVESRLLPAADKLGCVTIAYSPLARMANETSSQRMQSLARIATRYAATPEQLALRWLLGRGNIIAIPRTSNEHHLILNSQAAEIPLSPEDEATIDYLFAVEVRLLATVDILVSGSYSGKFYQSVSEARANLQGFSPSPLELAKEMRNTGELLKPIKVLESNNEKKSYQLVEGQLRYWGWVLAFEGQKPIEAVVLRGDA